MVADTSALIAFLNGEPEAGRIEAALLDAPRVFISTATLVEAGIVAERQYPSSGSRDLDRLLERLGVEVMPLTREHAELARTAHRQFGKGRHPAGLNFGDCFSYALARALGEPLLFVGNDFSKTDIGAAAYWGVEARGGFIIGVNSEDDTVLERVLDHVIRIPRTRDMLTPNLARMYLTPSRPQTRITMRLGAAGL